MLSENSKKLEKTYTFKMHKIKNPWKKKKTLNARSLNEISVFLIMEN